MNEEVAHELVEHLQSAALELIGAVRAVLDVAEDLVKDPSEAVAVAAGLAARTPFGEPPPATGDEADARVEHIDVS